MGPGEKAHLCRFTLTTARRVGSTAAFTQLRSHNAAHGLRTPGLAFAGAVLPGDPNVENLAEKTRFPHWEVNYPPLPGIEFRIDGKPYFLMGHDWRLEPPSVWAVNTTERAMTGMDPNEGGGARGGPVLSRTAFGTAVKDALKGLSNRDGLRQNPLLDCPLVAGSRAEQEATTLEEALAGLLTRAIEELEGRTDSSEYGQVLRATYLRPAPKQRAAAEMVGLSYATYRRRLQEAVEQLAEMLWTRECRRQGRAQGGDGGR
ncbi:MAG: hypothetical protein ABEJ96_07980 [Thiohalorhabdaceae bacterium]